LLSLVAAVLFMLAPRSTAGGAPTVIAPQPSMVAPPTPSPPPWRKTNATAAEIIRDRQAAAPPIGEIIDYKTSLTTY